MLDDILAELGNLFASSSGEDDNESYSAPNVNITGPPDDLESDINSDMVRELSEQMSEHMQQEHARRNSPSYGYIQAMENNVYDAEPVLDDDMTTQRREHQVDTLLHHIENVMNEEVQAPLISRQHETRLHEGGDKLGYVESVMTTELLFDQYHIRPDNSSFDIKLTSSVERYLTSPADGEHAEELFESDFLNPYANYNFETVIGPNDSDSTFFGVVQPWGAIGFNMENVYIGAVFSSEDCSGPDKYVLRLAYHPERYTSEDEVDDCSDCRYMAVYDRDTLPHDEIKSRIDRGMFRLVNGDCFHEEPQYCEDDRHVFMSNSSSILRSNSPPSCSYIYYPNVSESAWNVRTLRHNELGVYF